MKLIIQIPCSIKQCCRVTATSIASLPRSVAGCSAVEWLVIDDGSSDATAEIAKRLGVDHVIRHPINQWTCAAAIWVLLKPQWPSIGMDIIVNTDADNQYDARDIETSGNVPMGAAEFVIGSRPIDKTEHFSWITSPQHLVYRSARRFRHTRVADAPSGFRAMTRDVALRLNVFNTYTTRSKPSSSRSSHLRDIGANSHQPGYASVTTGERYRQLRDEITRHYCTYLRHLSADVIFLAVRSIFMLCRTCCRASAILFIPRSAKAQGIFANQLSSIVRNVGFSALRWLF